MVTVTYEDVPLFDLPNPVDRPLSELYAVPAYRASAREAPTYTKIITRGVVECDECFANQHESKGMSGPRARARVRRSFPGGPRLDLCRQHEELWKSRDEGDQRSTG